MIIKTSMGHVRLRRFGVRDLDTIGNDLIEFIIMSGKAITGEDGLPAGSGTLAENIIIAAIDGRKPKSIPLADLGPLMKAIWELNDMVQMGKLFGLYPAALQVQTALNPQSTRGLFGSK